MNAILVKISCTVVIAANDSMKNAKFVKSRLLLLTYLYLHMVPLVEYQYLKERVAPPEKSLDKQVLLSKKYYCLQVLPSVKRFGKPPVELLKQHVLLSTMYLQTQQQLSVKNCNLKALHSETCFLLLV